MQYRRLGHSGLKVSELSLGTMLFGSFADEATSETIIAKAREQGVNFIDSADVYVKGRAEQIVGRAIRRDRDSWVLATKLGGAMTDDPRPNQRGLSRKWIFREVENSLQRLGTDYIDVYYPHREDPTTPIAETLLALTDLVREGKIRYYGISNHQSWKLAEYSRVADQLGVPRPIASQLCYNAFDRRPEKDHFHITDYYGLGNVVYSPLARGVLTGKYRPDEEPAADTRAGRKDRKLYQTEWRSESLHASQDFKDYAARRGFTPAAFAVAWVLNNASVASVIAGPRTEAQWGSYVEALGIVLTPEDEAFVDGLVKPGYASTHGYSDPADTAPLRRLVRQAA